MYPLVRELAADGIPVTVTCRVLNIARQPYYRWLARPVTDAELVEAYRANALFDAHRDDPEFGYRFLADEALEAGQPMAERTAWRICSDKVGGRAFGKKRGKNGKKPARRSTTTCAPSRQGRTRHEFNAAARTSCGSATSPNTGPAKASSTSARSRTCTPTGSSATPSTHG